MTVYVSEHQDERLAERQHCQVVSFTQPSAKEAADWKRTVDAQGLEISRAFNMPLKIIDITRVERLLGTDDYAELIAMAPSYWTDHAGYDMDYLLDILTAHTTKTLQALDFVQGEVCRGVAQQFEDAKPTEYGLVGNACVMGSNFVADFATCVYFAVRAALHLASKSARRGLLRDGRRFYGADSQKYA